MDPATLDAPRAFGNSLGSLNEICWWQGLPAEWRERIVVPIRFEVFREYEMPAERTNGYDADEFPCYCAWNYVLSELRSDDDEEFYEEPRYAESTLAWRLGDGRWLVFNRIVSDYATGCTRSSYLLRDSMPR